MATTPIEFSGPEGLTLDVELFPRGSDTSAATAIATERTNQKGKYTADITATIAGEHDVLVREPGNVVIANYFLFLRDDTSLYLCGDVSYPQTTAGTGAGAVLCSFTIRDTSMVPLQDVEVWVSTDSDGQNVVAGTKETDANGVVEFMLDPGNFFLHRQKNGFDFPPAQPFTVVL